MASLPPLLLFLFSVSSLSPPCGPWSVSFTPTSLSLPSLFYSLVPCLFFPLVFHSPPRQPPFSCLFYLPYLIPPPFIFLFIFISGFLFTPGPSFHLGHSHLFRSLSFLFFSRILQSLHTITLCFWPLKSFFTPPLAYLVTLLYSTPPSYYPPSCSTSSVNDISLSLPSLLLLLFIPPLTIFCSSCSTLLVSV